MDVISPVAAHSDPNWGERSFQSVAQSESELQQQRERPPTPRTPVVTAATAIQQPQTPVVKSPMPVQQRAQLYQQPRYVTQTAPPVQQYAPTMMSHLPMDDDDMGACFSEAQAQQMMMTNPLPTLCEMPTRSLSHTTNQLRRMQQELQ